MKSKKELNDKISALVEDNIQLKIDKDYGIINHNKSTLDSSKNNTELLLTEKEIILASLHKE